jgi:hypothetical protein
VADLAAQQRGDLVDLLERVPAGIAAGHAEHVGVGPLLVRHLEHADRLRGHDATRKGRLRDADQHIQRITVGGERIRYVAVVRREDERGGDEAVELDPAEVGVVFVLVTAALRDLDDADQRVHVASMGLVS